MEHLIKQYFCFPEETLHQEMFFPNQLFCFHHLFVLIQKYYSRTIRFNTKNQQNKNFCWFFFALPSFKNIT